ncbi:Signal transduction histidine kinase [Microbacterium sp. cf046]|uniref:sensor histidine kinase n=1 Tax=Microbacterium sp. cf046 TaxID=1761803 RepID=UPI0008EB3E18|nr:sensor histidine kinase [Microbacterium sp. cf046]SFR92075.1 Signal transduction histidine kinase [Microbacterium sp. cf046]
MQNRRWWDAAVIAASLMVIVALVVGPSGTSGVGVVIAGAALVVFVLSYLLVARPALTSPRPWHLPAFVAGASVALAGGCAGEPFFTIMLAIAYPLTWVLAVGRRRAIVGSIFIALGTFVGFALFAGILGGGDAVIPALTIGAAVASFGLVFAIAFGVWIQGVVAYGQERARLLGELTAAQAEVEALSRDRGAAMERERLARDLHDTLAQTLAGLAILSERAGRQLDEGRTDAAADSIATVERLSRDALDEARAIVSRTAAVPSDAALGDAVDRLVDRFRAEAGLTIDLDLRLDSAGVLSRESQLVLLRCLQESLANVRKHAAATRVDVRVSAEPDGAARLAVTDDGRGFDVDARRDGFGLEGMAERVALAGGELEVSSVPGGGTTLVVRLPATPADRVVAQ